MAGILFTAPNCTPSTYLPSIPMAPSVLNKHSHSLSSLTSTLTGTSPTGITVNKDEIRPPTKLPTVSQSLIGNRLEFADFSSILSLLDGPDLELAPTPPSKGEAESDIRSEVVHSYLKSMENQQQNNARFDEYGMHVANRSDRIIPPTPSPPPPPSSACQPEPQAWAPSVQDETPSLFSPPEVPPPRRSSLKLRRYTDMRVDDPGISEEPDNLENRIQSWRQQCPSIQSPAVLEKLGLFLPDVTAALPSPPHSPDLFQPPIQPPYPKVSASAPTLPRFDLNDVILPDEHMGSEDMFSVRKLGAPSASLPPVSPQKYELRPILKKKPSHPSSIKRRSSWKSRRTRSNSEEVARKAVHFTEGPPAIIHPSQPITPSEISERREWVQSQPDPHDRGSSILSSDSGSRNLDYFPPSVFPISCAKSDHRGQQNNCFCLIL